MRIVWRIYYSEKNKFIEIRILNLLFCKPFGKKIIYSKDENRVTNGIRLMVSSYRPTTQMISCNEIEQQYECY